jgi:D-alanyl-lipoteichoic acid acyltransferase DltB (MBOAT superfamily)
MCWRAELIVLILFSSFSNWFISDRIYKSDNKRAKKRLLTLSLVINFGLLIIFKYLMFFSTVLSEIYALFGWTYPVGEFNIILPMGISFYTFQAASYTIDVYKGEYTPEKNYFKFTLFITFFPQLVAGPIERADRLLNQLFTKKKWSTENVSLGLKLMLLGYFKKMVIADRAAVLVNNVFNSCENYHGMAFIIAAFFFTLQIYGDFSGYTDIARGCAKILGIDLMLNFDKPYFANSIKDFWRRWHISLSQWFRDYVYIPLGGSRCSTLRKYLNLMITFLVSGLWHGANYTFIFWGGLHGAYQVIGDIKNKALSKIGIKTEHRIFNIVKIPITFVLVAFAWIFFRANSIGDGLYIVTHLFDDINRVTDMQYVYEVFNGLGLTIFQILIVFFAIVLLWLSEAVSGKYSITEFFDRRPFIIRYVYYFIISNIILLTGVFSDGGQFIYFQF